MVNNELSDNIIRKFSIVNNTESSHLILSITIYLILDLLEDVSSPEFCLYFLAPHMRHESSSLLSPCLLTYYGAR
jgi:hypothetical protein